MLKIGHASKTEHGKATGGTSGDQTGKEVTIRDYYNFGQTILFRFLDKTLAMKFVEIIKAACANDNIGYDQSNRTSFYKELKAVGYDPDKIKTPCECDCSSFIGACLNAVGIKVPHNFTTRSMETALAKQKELIQIVTIKEEFLQLGDILIKPNKHTVVVVEAPTKEEPKETKADHAMDFSDKYARAYVTTANLHLRKGATKTKESILVIPRGKKVTCYGYHTGEWLLVKYGNKTGFCNKHYLE